MYKQSDLTLILRYKAAAKINFSRQELALYYGITENTVLRGRSELERRTGIKLQVPDNNATITSLDKKRIVAYENALSDITYEYNKTNTTESLASGIYVITSAQNATPIHEKFWIALLNYCNARNAKLKVIPYRYKNVTSIWNENNQADDWWAPQLASYLDDKKYKLCDDLVLMADQKIQPTAERPLSGYEGVTGMASAIFGHPKIQQRVVPTPSKKTPKILVTTGTVTLPNYTSSKAGNKGDFHHSIAALVVEVDSSGTFYSRHIHADVSTGNFYDLDTLYTPTKIVPKQRIAAIVTGDSHAMFMDPTVEKATYTNKDSICNVLKPKVRVLHDVEDFYPRNHHHMGDDLISYCKHHFGRNNVEEGLQITADFIDRTSQDDMLNVYVKGNHEEAFDKWLRIADPKLDPENAKFYYYMKYNQLNHAEITPTGNKSIDPIEFWCNHPDEYYGLKTVDKTKFLKRDESFVVAGVEVGFHGDQGPNGTRGSLQAFKFIGPKVVIGHSHTPGIEDGAYSVGVSARLDLEYVKGPSSWMHTHCIIYPDGKRTLINITNGKWRMSSNGAKL